MLTEMLARLVTDKLAEFSYNAALAGKTLFLCIIWFGSRMSQGLLRVFVVNQSTPKHNTNMQGCTTP